MDGHAFETAIDIKAFIRDGSLKKQLAELRRWYKDNNVRILRINLDETTISITYIPVEYRRKVYLGWNRNDAYRKALAWSNRQCKKNDCPLSEVSVISLPAESRNGKTFFIATAFADRNQA